ncbi:hypothetical protein [Actinoplanes couchii]|uniref:Secreted protein n=1 Tax=Actinoplanes couchii TaxID=403638 RepID=A0ABQ3XEX7_9ACTN|nr:hypothetical protein [Actinoplanes couchii]MDR6319895.1 hypothetical protein [Actinoplanes couchii]GID57031.1 hypothetical protein Aco03nite_054350 [Actinoplanes couchii]
MRRLFRRTAAIAAAVILAVTATATPALADPTYATGFGKFNSATDCGKSVYLAKYQVKYWACSYNGAGVVRTGIAVQNYGDFQVYVEANYTRFRNYMSSQASSVQSFGPQGIYVPAHSTWTVWELHYWQGAESICSDNSGCYVQGTKGYIDAWAGGTSEHGASAYSPLQSIQDWCLDGPQITNWPDTGKCD